MVAVLGTVVSMTEAADQSADYLVGAPDALTITVWGQPNLSGKFVVEADGTFTFPLVGHVKAGGLTLRAIESELKRRLREGFLKNPQVSVGVEAYRSQQIFIVGEVRAPGAYPLTGNMTLIEALARAGSTTFEASGEALILRAPGRVPEGAAPSDVPLDQSREVVRVQLQELETGGWTHNVRLQDGDTIFVSRAASLYIVGQVRSPGAYRIQPGGTVLQALSLAGGVTDRASTRRIKIIRTVNGQKKEETKVSLDDAVRPGDTIVVPERLF